MERRRLRRWWTGSAVLVSSLLGCDVGLGEDQPETARIEVTSDMPVTVDLLSSTDFFTRTDGTLDTGSSDTERVELPYEQDVDLADPARLLVRVSLPADSLQASVRMRVFLDGERWYDETEDLGSSESRSLMQFVYLFYVPSFRSP